MCLSLLRLSDLLAADPAQPVPEVKLLFADSNFCRQFVSAYPEIMDNPNTYPGGIGERQEAKCILLKRIAFEYKPASSKIRGCYQSKLLLPYCTLHRQVEVDARADRKPDKQVASFWGGNDAGNSNCLLLYLENYRSV